MAAVCEAFVLTSARVSVVTGATGGIGQGVVRALLARGRTVLACGRDGAALAELAGEGAQPLAIDLCAEGALTHVARAAAALGAVHELIYAAGVVRYEPVGRISPESLDAQWSLNLRAALLLAQQLAQPMAASGEGAMVFVSSTLAERPAPETLAYAATKAGLLAMVRGLAQELAASGVRVNAVVPGVVDTAMVRAARAEGPLDAQEQLAQLARLHPLGRLGTPADVADAIVYLLEARWVTGSALRVDGGLLVG